MYLINSLILALSICYIIDISGFMTKVNISVFKWLYGQNIAYNGWYIPLFGCSRCLSFWTVLIYGLIWSNIEFIYIVGTASLLSLLAPIFSDSLNYIIRTLSGIFNR